MNQTLRKLATATFILAAFAATSSVYAHQKSTPAMDHNMMMGSGGMGMMEQMNKMMGLCNQMMEAALKDKDGSKMPKPEDGQKMPQNPN